MKIDVADNTAMKKYITVSIISPASVSYYIVINYITHMY